MQIVNTDALLILHDLLTVLHDTSHFFFPNYFSDVLRDGFWIQPLQSSCHLEVIWMAYPSDYMPISQSEWYFLLIGINWHESLVTQRGWRRNFCWFHGFIQQKDGMSINAIMPLKKQGILLSTEEPPSAILNPALLCPSVGLKGAKCVVLALEWEISNMHILTLVLSLSACFSHLPVQITTPPED